MKRFNLFWKFSGIKNYTHEVIEAKNLPHAMAIAGEKHDWRIKRRCLVTGKNRRIQFFGYAGEGTLRVPAPLIQGVITNA
jgi:hypothetical protein